MKKIYIAIAVVSALGNRSFLHQRQNGTSIFLAMGTFRVFTTAKLLFKFRKIMWQIGKLEKIKILEIKH